MVPADFDACKEHGHDVGDEDEGGGGTDGRHSDRSIAVHVVHYAQHHHEVMMRMSTNTNMGDCRVIFIDEVGDSLPPPLRASLRIACFMMP